METLACEAVVDGDAGPRERRRERGRRAVGLAAVAVPLALYTVHAARYGRWLVDDAGITLAYARDLTTGHGLVAQPGGEHVEGYSDPLWLLVLAAGRAAGLSDRGHAVAGIADTVLFVKAVAVACFLGVLLAFRAAARAVSSRPALVTLLAGTGLALLPSWTHWSVSGLENPLYGLEVAVLAAVLVRTAAGGGLTAWRPAVAAGLVACAAALTRPDGVAYGAAYPLLALALVDPARWRPAARAAALATAAFAVPYGSFLAWRYAVFGALVPNTAVAKVQPVPRLRDFARPGEVVAAGGWLLVLLAGGAVVLAATAGPARVRRGLVAAVLVPLLGLAVYGALEADWMNGLRFASPVWVAGALACALGLVEAAPLVGGRARAVAAALLAVATVLALAGYRAAEEDLRTHPTLALCDVTDRYGRTFDAYADRLGIRHGSLLLPDIGGVLLTSHLRVVDLAGLTDRAVARTHQHHDMAGLRNLVLDRVRPTFVSAHDSWAFDTGLFTDPRLARDYLPIVDGQDYVRRDATDSARVAALRPWAAAQVARVEARYGAHPRAGCGTFSPPSSSATASPRPPAPPGYGGATARAASGSSFTDRTMTPSG